MAFIINEELTRQLKETISEVGACCEEKKRAAENCVSYEREGGTDQEILDELQKKKDVAEDALCKAKALLADFVLEHQTQVQIADDAEGEAEEEDLGVDRIGDYIGSEVV